MLLCTDPKEDPSQATMLLWLNFPCEKHMGTKNSLHTTEWHFKWGWKYWISKEETIFHLDKSVYVLFPRIKLMSIPLRSLQFKAEANSKLAYWLIYYPDSLGSLNIFFVLLKLQGFLPLSNKPTNGKLEPETSLLGTKTEIENRKSLMFPWGFPGVTIKIDITVISIQSVWSFS